jgi:hypothetical protein
VRVRGWAGEGRWAARGGRGKRKERAAAGLREGREEGEWPARLGPKEEGREEKKEERQML